MYIRVHLHEPPHFKDEETRGASLGVQWLRLCASTVKGVQVRSLVGN